MNLGEEVCKKNIILKEVISRIPLNHLVMRILPPRSALAGFWLILLLLSPPRSSVWYSRVCKLNILCVGLSLVALRWLNDRM